MQLIKNYLYNVFYQLFILIVPLITMPYISRVLGPTGSGINYLTSANTQYFILLGSLGITLYGNRQIAYLRDNKQRVSQAFWEIFLLRCLTTLVALSSFYIFVYFNHTYQWAYLMQSILIIATALDISWFFMGVENFKVTVSRNMIVKIFSILFIFTLVKTKNDVIIYIFILSLSQLLGNLTLFPYLRHYINWPQWRQLQIWQHLRPSLALFLPQVAMQIYLILNKTMVGWLVSVKATGFYTYSDNTIRAVLTLGTSLATVMMPRVANTFIHGDIKQVNKYTQLSFDFASAVAVPLMFGIAAVSLKFVPSFLGADYSPVAYLMIIETLLILPVTWASIIGNQYLIPLGRNRTYTNSVLLGALVSIVLNVPLILLFQTQGAMIASVVCEFAVAFYQLYAIRQELPLRFLFNEFWKYLFAGLIMFVIVFYLHLHWKFTLLTFFVEIAAGIFIYLAGLLILKAPVLSRLKILLAK